ncbi:MAG: hypothetical protein WBK91_01215 [Alphaproteobacteria bacterium]
MGKDDQYLSYLESEISNAEIVFANAKAALAEKMASKANYLAFKTKNGVTPAKTAGKLQSPKNKTSEDSDRKGLRGKGRTRDVFEFFTRADAGATTNEASKGSGYSPQEISQVYFRYSQDGYFTRDDNRILLTPKGKELLDKSQPYTGDNPAFIQRQLRIVP